MYDFVLTLRHRAVQPRERLGNGSVEEVLMFTGYHIEDGYIIGEEMSGRFYIEDDVIKGPKNSGKYYLSDNCICGPDESGHFYIEDGYIYGPSKDVPWLRD